MKTETKKLPNGNAFKVESGIEVPPSGAGRPTKYPFAAMKVGDSFFIASGEQHRVAMAAGQWGPRHKGTKFTVRKVENGARCWRVK